MLHGFDSSQCVHPNVPFKTNTHPFMSYKWFWTLNWTTTSSNSKTSQSLHSEAMVSWRHWALYNGPPVSSAFIQKDADKSLLLWDYRVTQSTEHVHPTPPHTSHTCLSSFSRSIFYASITIFQPRSSSLPLQLHPFVFPCPRRLPSHLSLYLRAGPVSTVFHLSFALALSLSCSPLIFTPSVHLSHLIFSTHLHSLLHQTLDSFQFKYWREDRGINAAIASVDCTW